MPADNPKNYQIKSYSLPAEQIDFLNAVAWSRRVSASSVVAWALLLLAELLDGEPEG